MNNHRYELRREWIGNGGIVNFIMLNPSTADDKFDDPTIRKCCGFAKRWGYRGITVTNLFAFRATDPKELKALAKSDYSLAIGGGENNCRIAAEAWKSDLIVIAWGANAAWCTDRVNEVLGTVLPFDRPIHMIGMTQSGHPIHPCMAPYTDVPMLYRSGD